MYHISKKSALLRFTIILFIVGLVICSFGSMAGAQDEFARFPTDERSAESMVFDLALVRPLGIVGIVFGTGAFILSLPFSALGDNTDEAFERLMADPARYTFKRPLGDF
ncbi:MAG: hypothetical protein MUD09_04940 [Desulfobacterales bacterium]|nr:hypothetical protein [Desulfobacterales bacterium]